MTNKHNVFVYGTLRTGNEATHHILNHEMFSAGKFPFIKPSNGGKVLGNLVQVDADELKAFDKYENIEGGLYTREETLCHNNITREEGHCFIYVGTNIFFPPKIESGDWLNP